MPFRASGRLIGPHLPVKGGLLKTAERAREIGATALQIFTDNPTSWRRRSELPTDLERFRQLLAQYEIGPLAIHAPYLINLCGSRADFWLSSCATLANEIRVGAKYGASFVVAHIGSDLGQGREQGLARLAEGLARVLDEARQDGGPLLVLENSAGTGDGLGSSLEDLADIMAAAQARGIGAGEIGFCLDTAHLWGAGHALDQPAEIDRLVERAAELLGREHVVMLHLNDTRTACGSRLDRHEHIGAGQIGVEGLRHLLMEPWLSSLPTYLETPGMDVGYDAVNLERVQLLLAGEPLPDLPPEAFAVRGARSRAGPSPDLT
jgi:deoxyribonuclease-4